MNRISTNLFIYIQANLKTLLLFSTVNFIFSILLISDVIFFQYKSESFLFFKLFIFYFFTFVLIQSLIILLFSFHKSLAKYLTSIFLSLNIILFKLINFSIFNDLNSYIKLIIFVFFILLFSRIILVNTKRIFSAFFLFALIPFSFLFSNLASYKINTIDTETNLFVENYEPKMPLFKQKPNVYIIGYDGFAPEVMTKKFINDEFSPSKSVSNRIIKFKNNFAYGNTRHTWGAILTFGLGPENKFDMDPDYSLNSMTGIEKNLLFEIFKNNGYDIFTGMTITHFGKTKGHEVSNFLTYAEDGTNTFDTFSVVQSSLSCLNQVRTFNIPKYYGFCTLPLKSKKFNKFANHILNLEALDKIEDHDFMMRYLKNSNSPKLFVYHSHCCTGHVSDSYNYKNKEHVKNFSKIYSSGLRKIESNLEDILNFIDNHDPRAIVLILGDHSGLFRTPQDLHKKEIYKDKEYVISVLGAQLFLLKTNNECSSNELKFTDQLFNQPTHVIAGIVDCLSIENNFFVDKLFDKSIWFKDNLRTLVHVQKEPVYIDLNDYLYE